MRIKYGVPLIILLFFLSTSALPYPCGKKDGMGVFRTKDESGYILYGFREGPDFAFMLPGKEISFPDGLQGKHRFFLDEILFESLTVKLSDFMKPRKGVADLDILKKHQAYEYDYMQKTPTTLRQLVVLGPREKPAANGQPSFTFYLWEAMNPNDQNGARQYFLSTVSGGEVVLLSAVVLNQANEGAAMQAFESYASSFHHLLNKERCPENSTK